MSPVWANVFRKSWGGYLIAVLGNALVTAALKLFGDHINSTTVALALLLVVIFVATAWGSRPAVAASLLGVLCFNFFYLPPVGRLTIDDPDNWIAFVAFLVTAVTVGQLSARAKRRAVEAEVGRREIERLYRELQEAFEQASQAKALQQSERLKAALLDAVTHDLRTPLTSIKASVTTLLDELNSKSEGEEQVTLGAEGRQEMLEVIDEEADRLNRFIEGMVELARIEAGELRLRRRWGSVEEIVAAALGRAAPLTRGHSVETVLERELPSVRVDARAVAEVVYALVDNAAKYSAAGTRIRVAAGQDDEAIRLTVEDEGPGIPTHMRARVFDKFFRAMRDGDSGKHQPQGTGMGLSIAQGIVEAHGGRIWIEDGRGGRGSRVVVVLPIGDQEEPAVRHEDEAEAVHARDEARDEAETVRARANGHAAAPQRPAGYE
jgi:K+-sensing histidine kinase KdpD